jgi:3-oxoacyl-[acyl-carrier protein] reductase
MDLGVEGKKFLIGGGSRGLGNAVATILAAEGAQVLLMSRSAEGLSDAAARIGSSAGYVAVDMAETTAVESVSRAVDEQLGGLDGILVNAGGPPPGKVFDLTDDQWRDSFELLIGGPIRMLRALTPKITDGGAMLFITSTSFRQPVLNLDTSNVLRPGVTAMAKVLAQELAPSIRVNCLAPGRFDTDRVRSLDEVRAKERGVTPEEQREFMREQIPLGRYGAPVEFGRIGAFLLSPAASFVSGVALPVDGAMVTALP